jgi:hypothetical protein
MTTPNFPTHWPYADQDIVDSLPRTHWFRLNCHRLIRTPTRQELLSPYMPPGIITDQTEVIQQRLREAIAFLIREANREGQRAVSEEHAVADDESRPMEGICTNPDVYSATDDQDEEGKLALIYQRSNTSLHSNLFSQQTHPL